MKRCPLCNAFASNDATTCFECLYSFEHMAPLEESMPKSKKQEKDSGQLQETKRIPIPAPRKTDKDPSKTCASSKTSSKTARSKKPIGSTGSAQKPVRKPVRTSTGKPIVITIRIDGGDAEVVVQ